MGTGKKICLSVCLWNALAAPNNIPEYMDVQLPTKVRNFSTLVGQMLKIFI